MSTALVILAAGKGTRMKSDLPKVLHQIGFAPMLAHAMRAGAALAPERTVVVAGHGADRVARAAEAVDPSVQVVLQERQLGTAHAVGQAEKALSDFDGDVIVLYGDTPFISAQTLSRMVAARQNHDLVVLGFEPADPARYGRLIMQDDRLDAIVEYRDATDAQRAIGLCNSGVLACDAKLLFSMISAVGNDNAAGEYYLTDIVGLARDRGLKATAVTCDPAETLGVNSRADLAHAEQVFQDQRRQSLMAEGVTLLDPASTFLAFDTVIGADAIVEPHVIFGPGVVVEPGCHVRGFSHLEGCHVAAGATVGPYARLRPGTRLAPGARIGNFVEIKNARIGDGAKVNHLSYVGDASIGARSNVGAGTITCNYDGVMKHHTEIGSDVFVGSNTLLVAPVTVGDAAMTATGTVVTRDVAPGDLAVGRARQENKPGYARRLFEMLRARRAKQDKGQH